MEYRQLGRSGLLVSSLALGTMTFGGRGAFANVGSTELDEARRLLDRALDAGVNLIDTADIYSDGRSEEIVGEVLAGRRHEVVLATKARFATGPGPNQAGLSRAHLISACEASLQRLRTDYIDLYQVHERDGLTPVEETIDALDTLVHQGKVRYVGCSNHSAWHAMKALGVAERLGRVRYVSHQIYYSLLHREAEHELVPMAVDEGLGILVWSPLAGGWLSGKYRRGEPLPPGSRQASPWGEPPIYDSDHLYDVIEGLAAVARDLGRSPAQVALAFLLDRPGVTSVIIGARHEEQLNENLDAASVRLDEESRRRLEALSPPRLDYPYWHQARTAAERLSEGDRTLLERAIAPVGP
jgi:aryl-alcohol dehydrogenase-like predicted oxidoreductase